MTQLLMTGLCNLQSCLSFACQNRVFIPKANDIVRIFLVGLKSHHRVKALKLCEMS